MTFRNRFKYLRIGNGIGPKATLLDSGSALKSVYIETVESRSLHKMGPKMRASIEVPATNEILWVY